MSADSWPKGWVPRSVRLGLILAIALAGSLFVLMEPSLTWYAAVAAAAGLLTMGLAVGNMRKVLLSALAFLIPFFIHKALFVRENRVGEIVSLNVAVIDAILLLLIFVWLADSAVNKHSIFLLFPSVTIPAAIWLMVSALSILDAADSTAGLFRLIAMVRALVLYLVVANQIRATSDAAPILVALLTGLCLQCVLGIYQAWSGQPLGLWFLGESPEVREFALDIGLAARPHGTLGHPNSLAMYLGMLLPLALTLPFARIRALLKLLASLVFLTGFVALILTLSRGGWVGFGLGTVTVLFFLVRRSWVRLERVASTLMWLALALLVVAGVFSGQIASRLRSSDEGAFASRLLLMRGAVAMIGDHPWLGVGLDNYALVAPQYNPSQTEHWTAGQTYVHNILLFVGAEVGIIGLAAFIWMLLAFLWQGLAYVHRGPPGLNWMVGLGVLAGSLSVLLHSQVDYALLATPSLSPLFWFLVGWLMAISRGEGAQMQHGETQQ